MRKNTFLMDDKHILKIILFTSSFYNTLLNIQWNILLFFEFNIRLIYNMQRFLTKNIRCSKSSKWTKPENIIFMQIFIQIIFENEIIFAEIWYRPYSFSLYLRSNAMKWKWNNLEIQREITYLHKRKMSEGANCFIFLIVTAEHK